MRLSKAIKQYRQDKNVSARDMAKSLNVSTASIYGWETERYRPGKKKKAKLKELGIQWEENDGIREERRKKALYRKFEEQDKKNKLPRPYKRQVIVPDILAGQMANMLEEYVRLSNIPRTMHEFAEIKYQFVRDMFYLVEQHLKKG